MAFLLTVLAVTLSCFPIARGLTHYPPNSSNINNLAYVINGTSAPGIYNSSDTPDAEYGIYNWCNMPHVRAREYQ